MADRNCPKCGNVIQPFMHGTCYVCARRKDEKRRYGRRRPQRRVRPVKPPPKGLQRLRQKQETCPICDKRLRADRLFGHMWHTHGVDPYTPKRELRRLAMQWQAKHSERAAQHLVPLSQPERMVCSVCGAGIVRQRMKPHMRYHERMATNFDSLRLRKGINDLLAQVYEQPRLLSEILRDSGMSTADIRQLRYENLDAFLVELAKRWYAWMSDLLTPRRCNLLTRRYSLDGGEAPDLEALASEFGTPQGLLSLLEGAALVELRKSSSRKNLERIALSVAQETLKRVTKENEPNQ